MSRASADTTPDVACCQAPPDEYQDSWFRDLSERSGALFFAIQVEPEVDLEFISDSLADLLGYTPAEFIADDTLLAHSVDADDAATLASVFSSPPSTPASFDVRWRHRDGRIVWTEIWLRRRIRPDSSVVVEGTVHDTTAQHRIREQLLESEQHFRLLAQNSADVVFLADNDSVVGWVSPSIREQLGWEAAELIGRSTESLILPEDRATVTDALTHANGEIATYTARFLHRAGGSVWMGVTARRVCEGDTVVGWVGSARSIQAEHDARERLTESEHRFRAAMDGAPIGMALLDPDRRFIEVNPALCRLLGLSEGWLLRHGIWDVLDPGDDAIDLRMRDQLNAGGSPVSQEHQIVRSDRSRLWVEHSIGAVRGAGGEITAYISQFMDVTEAREASDQLRFLATHDVLTTLMNRRELVTRVESLLQRTDRTGSRICVMFLDLDNLKSINDTHGHAAGDRVIRSTADRLRSQVRRDDIVARFAGDEFVMVLPGVHDLGNARALAAKIHTAMAEPIPAGDEQLTTSISIGVALTRPGDNAASVIARADRALYRAKREGRDRTEYSD